jgi:hypothetical protein
LTTCQAASATEAIGLDLVLATPTGGIAARIEVGLAVEATDRGEVGQELGALCILDSA